MLTLRVIGRLLSYPDVGLRAALPELRDALRSEAFLSPSARAGVERLMLALGGGDTLDRQAEFVSLFDRVRTLSLHLFEHVHGDSRDRGPAMLDLVALYRQHGLDVTAGELPDYLPLFLEFLSTRPEAEAAELLAQTAHIAAALKERLKKRASVYVNAFGVLEALGQGRPDATLLRELLDAPEDDPDDLEALDRVWEEEAVTFGGNAGENACGPDRLRTQMRAAARKPDQSPTA